MDPWWWLVIIVIFLVCYLIFTKPDPFQRLIVFISDGIVISIGLTIVSFVMTLLLGLIGGLGRLSKNKIIYTIATLYVEIIRGIPLLVQLIWWYFAFPSVIQGIGKAFGIVALEPSIAALTCAGMSSGPSIVCV